MSQFLLRKAMPEIVWIESKLITSSLHDLSISADSYCSVFNNKGNLWSKSIMPIYLLVTWMINSHISQQIRKFTLGQDTSEMGLLSIFLLLAQSWILYFNMSEELIVVRDQTRRKIVIQSHSQVDYFPSPRKGSHLGNMAKILRGK